MAQYSLLRRPGAIPRGEGAALPTRALPLQLHDHRTLPYTPGGENAAHHQAGKIAAATAVVILAPIRSNWAYQGTYHRVLLPELIAEGRRQAQEAGPDVGAEADPHILPACGDRDHVSIASVHTYQGTCSEHPRPNPAKEEWLKLGHGMMKLSIDSMPPPACQLEHGVEQNPQSCATCPRQPASFQAQVASLNPSPGCPH